MRDLATQTSGREGARAMRKWGYIAMQAVGAFVFFFLLQRYALKATLESSLIWALTLAVCAAGLAHMQANR